MMEAEDIVYGENEPAHGIRSGEPELKGIVTRIQRMSVHDGPGIRTTLFFKGCNFRCKWCHNPETWQFGRQLEHVTTRCIGCAACVGVCKTHAVRRTLKGICFSPEDCDACGRCVSVCPAGAMTMVGEEVSVESLTRELRKDRIYFDESGGGVTLSGGEPFLQFAFVKSFLEACRAENISTAIETNLSAPPEQIRELVPLVDWWMCDLKLADEDAHRRWTGMSNNRTISNLRMLGDSGIPVVVRTPVIPGVNDSVVEIEALGDIVKGIGSLKYYELLGFHTLGADKFSFLGMDNPMCGVEPLLPERLESLKSVVSRMGINVK